MNFRHVSEIGSEFQVVSLCVCVSLCIVYGNHACDCVRQLLENWRFIVDIVWMRLSLRFF